LIFVGNRRADNEENESASFNPRRIFFEEFREEKLGLPNSLALDENESDPPWQPLRFSPAGRDRRDDGS